MNNNSDNGYKQILSSGAKVGAKAGKKALKIAKGAIISLASTIGVPVLIVVFTVVILVTTVSFVLFGDRGERENYNVNSMQTNEFEVDENGTSYVTDKKDDQALAEKYYKFFSIQSYYKVSPGGKFLSFKDNTEDFCTFIDYYGKEDSYYLSNSLLMSLDEICHKYKFIYPEQFIKPVYTEGGEGKVLGELVDEDENILCESKEYGEDGQLTGKMVKGVWDYGLAPILYYKEDSKVKCVSGKYDKKQVVRDNQIVWVPIDESFDDIYFEDTREKIYLVSDTVSISGEVAYKYENQNVYYSELTEGFSDNINSYYDKIFYGTGTIKEKTVDENGNVKTITVTVPLYKHRNAKVYDYLPVEVNQESNLKGQKYFYDYLSLYKTYVPETVTEELSLRNRMDESKELLEKLEILDVFNTTQTTYHMVGSLPAGSQISSSSYENAKRYYSICEKYGGEFGIDPNVLVAMIAQESGGEVKADGGGLMQITLKGELSATNKFGEKKTVKIKDLDLYNADDNIKVGAMYLRTCLDAFKDTSGIDNYVLGLTSYNLSVTKVNSILTYYRGEHPEVNLIDIYKDTTVCEWLGYRERAGMGDPLYYEHVMSYYSGSSLPEVSGFSATAAVNAISDSYGNESLLSKALKKAGSFFGDLASTFGDLFSFDNHSESEKRIPYEVNLGMSDFNKILANAKAFDDHIDFYTAYNRYMEGDVGGEEYVGNFVYLSGASGDIQGYNPELAAILEGCVNPTDFTLRKTSRAGYRLHPIDKVYKMHYGTDYSCASGTKLVSPSDAYVELAAKGKARGNYVVLNFNGVTVLYEHMSRLSVRTGQSVKKGEEVGFSGNTGASTGPHLHFELMYNGKYYAPDDYFYK